MEPLPSGCTPLSLPQCPSLRHRQDYDVYSPKRKAVGEASSRKIKIRQDDGTSQNYSKLDTTNRKKCAEAARKMLPITKVTCWSSWSISFHSFSNPTLQYLGSPLAGDSTKVCQESCQELLVDSNFIIDRHEIFLGEKLGEGCFGIVYKGRWTDLDVAVKQQKHGVTGRELESLRKEVSITCTLRHPNIVSFFGVTPPPEPLIVSELLYCSLLDILHILPSMRLSNRAKMHILRDISCGLAYLHTRSPPILHRDLSSNNVLLIGDAPTLEDRSSKNEPIAKLNDFGLSRRQGRNMSASIGNFHYLAPEVYAGERYDSKADIYSLAVLSWEIFTEINHQSLQEPFPAAYQSSVLGFRPHIPNRFSKPLRGLIESCWQHLPSNRPTSVKVLQCVNHWLGVSTTSSLPDVSEGADVLSRQWTIVPSIVARQRLIDPTLYGLDRLLAELPSELPTELLVPDQAAAHARIINDPPSGPVLTTPPPAASGPYVRVGERADADLNAGGVHPAAPAHPPMLQQEPIARPPSGIGFTLPLAVGSDTPPRSNAQLALLTQQGSGRLATDLHINYVPPDSAHPDTSEPSQVPMCVQSQEDSGPSQVPMSQETPPDSGPSQTPMCISQEMYPAFSPL